MRRSLLALVLLAVPALAAAQLYRWVDERGRVHYGDKPPPGVKSVPMQKAEPPPAAAKPGARQRHEDTENAEALKQREAQRAREAQWAKDRIAREAPCEKAKEALAFAERNRLYHEKKAKKPYFTDEEQRDEIHRRRAEVSRNCW